MHNERGKGLPDASIMLNLCDILEISVNDLLSGEKVDKDSYVAKVEENFVNLKKKVDRVVKIINAIGWGITAIMISLFFIHMYFNWLYKGPWDDSNFRTISNILLVISIIGFLITSALEYEVKK